MKLFFLWCCIPCPLGNHALLYQGHQFTFQLQPSPWPCVSPVLTMTLLLLWLLCSEKVLPVQVISLCAATMHKSWNIRHGRTGNKILICTFFLCCLYPSAHSYCLTELKWFITWVKLRMDPILSFYFLLRTTLRTGGRWAENTWKKCCH